MTHKSALIVTLALIAFGCGGLTGCSTTPAEDTQKTDEAREAVTAEVTSIHPPVGDGAMAPNLATGSSGTYLTWLEPVSDGEGQALYFSILGPEATAWSEPELVVQGQGFFANWADLPAATEAADGTRFAHWLGKLGEGTYAYGAALARFRSADESWQKIGLLHDDDSPSEHGFVSYAPLSEGGIQAFWLDGRAMPGGGDMQLRTTLLAETLTPDKPQPSELLDERVCECCATDAALTDNGPVVVYRDRSPEEIRDISVVRATADGWSRPAVIHDDGWQIHGCPVNGPSITARGNHVAVAWFSAGGVAPSVKVALSKDGGALFSEPVIIDDQAPLGRVDSTHDAQGRAVVTWMGTSQSGIELRFRTVDSNGRLGKVHVVTDTSGRRSAGVPRMVTHGDRLLFAWVEDAQPSTVRAGFVDAR